MNEQLELFTDMKVKRTRKNYNYGEFTDKFKVKLTTDDCYTPEPIYNAVKDWTVKHYGLEGREIVRPFWPGGDFECFEYPDNCVVIDNPPFSLYDKILKLLKDKGYWIYGTDMNGTNYSELDYKGKTCIICGNEGSGMSKLTKENCDFIAMIDMVGKVNSLNASNASAIAVYEVVRQRNK